MKRKPIVVSAAAFSIQLGLGLGLGLRLGLGLGLELDALSIQKYLAIDCFRSLLTMSRRKIFNAGSDTSKFKIQDSRFKIFNAGSDTSKQSRD